MVATILRCATFAVVLTFLGAASGCGTGAKDGFERVRGNAMGTTYAVQAACAGAVPAHRLMAVLERIEREMSTHDGTSELSTFNRAPVGVVAPVSPWLVAVASAAQRVAEETGGAFDATVGPLVGFWGFGAEPATEPPDMARLKAAKGVVGYRRLKVQPRPATLEKLAEVRVDFSAIAKGFAIDRMAVALDEASCSAYLIEFGGEARAFGSAPDGGPWRVGVEPPGDGWRSPIVLRIQDGAVATAGDYRQFREPTAAERELLPAGQTRISHIVDPRSGLPVGHALASVTVVAQEAMFADAYATALFVLGAEAGMAFAESHAIAALFVERGDHGLEIRGSAAMDAYTDY